MGSDEEQTTKRLSWPRFWNRVKAPIIVLAISVILFAIIRLVFQYWVPQSPPKSTWENFWDQWGVALGIIYAVLVTMIASTLPSNLEGRIADKLKLLEDKIGSPISDFHEVLRRTEILLKNLHSGPDSELLIIVASPMIDLEDKEGKLRRALKERI